MSKILVAPSRRKKGQTPFDIHYGLSEPGPDVGADGDFFFCYSASSETSVYKKTLGSWNPLSGFTGFTSSNSEVVELTTSASVIIVTNFNITANTNLRVEVGGKTLYEGYNWDRDINTNSIIFDDIIDASTSNKILVFVGAYS